MRRRQLQSAVNSGSVDGLSSGHKGRPCGDLAVGDVPEGPESSLCQRAAFQGAGVAECFLAYIDIFDA